jgi:hypothetical protein
MLIRPGGRLSVPESLRPTRANALSERIEEQPSQASDIVGMVVYSILVPFSW